MAAIRGVPHPFPYQGSKRQLASQIVACIPRETSRLIEPFVGSGAVTLATAYLRRSCHFVIGDIHEPLIRLWESIIYDPDRLADQYEKLWRRQIGRQREFYEPDRAHCLSCGRCFASCPREQLKRRSRAVRQPQGAHA